MNEIQSIDSGASLLKNNYTPTTNKMHQAILRKKAKLKLRGVAPEDSDSNQYLEYDKTQD